MKKYLVYIEFRYRDAPNYKRDYTSMTKKITLGVYGTFEEACIEGNKMIEVLESKYALHIFPSGLPAKKERFSKNGGPFGTKNDLISNLAYLKTPFAFYARISTLKYEPIEESLKEVTDSIKRYRKFKQQEEDE